jgi:TatD DNase family protein
VILCDTHTHLYLDAFNDDRHEAVDAAIAAGVKIMLLPNIDSGSVEGMLGLCRSFPDNCFPMMGLHPGSVNENYLAELSVVETWLGKERFFGMGETGIDLYWDTTHQAAQEVSFRQHAIWAQAYDLPLVIHSRNSIGLILDILEDMKLQGLRGIFHCFGSPYEDARRALNLGFLLGIGGTVTYKKSILTGVLPRLLPENLVLETDAPFLPPVPYRGKRNESAYLPLVAGKLSEIYKVSQQEIARITTQNALHLFKINENIH